MPCAALRSTSTGPRSTTPSGSTSCVTAASRSRTRTRRNRGGTGVTARRAALDSPGRAVACLALALAVLGASPAAGQEGVLPGEVAHTAPGMVTAQTFDAPGQAFSVAVSPYDDSDLNLKLKADFEAALAEDRKSTRLNSSHQC